MENPRAGGARVSDVEPAGRRSESNPSKAITQPLDAITVFAPWAADAERGLRVRIHRARDSAQARAARSKHARARTIYWLAAQFAGDWVFARAATDDLEEIIKGLTWFFLAAGLIERLEAPDE